MRLWHQDLLPILPTAQLLGQHRECCALRGKGWGRPHSTVNYVFTHPRWWLWLYHMQVMSVMLYHGYHPDMKWYMFNYRGRNLAADTDPISSSEVNAKIKEMYEGKAVYPEHNPNYLTECIDNLRSKKALPEENIEVIFLQSKEELII